MQLKQFKNKRALFWQGNDLYRMSFPLSEEFNFKKRLRDKFILSQYMEHDKKMVGLLIASNFQEYYHVHLLCVHPQYVNRGIGSFMLKNFIHEHKKNMTILCHEDNEKMKSILPKLGFEQISLKEFVELRRENGYMCYEYSYKGDIAWRRFYK